MALILVRGAGAILAGQNSTRQVATNRGEAPDPETAAFAIRFARTYLADPSAQALVPFLAEGANLASGRPPTEAGAEVLQAELSSSEQLGGGEEVLTVACELRDSRTLYLAVPIARSRAGEVAALGAPSIVAAPGVAAGAERKRPQTIAGSQAGAIESLVERFLPEYVSAEEAGDLSYLQAPGIVIQPLGGQLRFESLSGVTQLGSGEGPRRTVIVAVRVSDPSGGGTYPLAYRLDLVEVGGRWYVEALEGASL